MEEGYEFVKKKMKKERAPRNIFIKKNLLRDCEVKKKSSVNILLVRGLRGGGRGGWCEEWARSG